MRLTGLVVALGVFCAAASARAEPGPSRDVVVVVGEPSDQVVQSLLAQLAQSQLPARGSSSVEPSLSSIAAAEGVPAVVRVQRGHEALEVWLASLQAGRPMLDLRLRGRGDPESLVLQCVELLRSQPELGAANARRAAPAQTAPTVQVPPKSSRAPSLSEERASSRTNARLELGTGYNLASRQLHWASVDAAAGLRWRRALLTLRASVPWWGADFEQPEGHALVHSPGLAVAAELLSGQARFGFGGGPLLGVRALRITGTDSRVHVSDQDAMLLELGVQGRVECDACLGLRSFLSLRAGYLLPSARVRFSGSERTSFGPVVVGAVLGIALEGGE